MHIITELQFKKSIILLNAVIHSPLSMAMI
jgi:hypothetical protein